MEEQPRRELASANPTAGAENATLQKPWISPEIPLNPCRRLQHLQPPTPSHIGPNAPSAPRRRDEHLARGARSSLNIRRRRLGTLIARRRDNPGDIALVQFGFVRRSAKRATETA